MFNDYDDVVQDGLVGLVKCLDNVNEEYTNFESYIGMRIKGEIVDAQRRNAWEPRTVRNRRIALDNVDSTKKEYAKERNYVQCGSSADIPKEIPSIEHNFFIKEQLYHVLKDAFLCLTGTEMFIIKQKYFKGLRGVEIANIMDVSESYVSILHAKAIKKLKLELVAKNIYYDDEIFQDET